MLIAFFHDRFVKDLLPEVAAWQLGGGFAAFRIQRVGIAAARELFLPGRREAVAQFFPGFRAGALGERAMQDSALAATGPAGAPAAPVSPAMPGCGMSLQPRCALARRESVADRQTTVQRDHDSFHGRRWPAPGCARHVIPAQRGGALGIGGDDGASGAAAWACFPALGQTLGSRLRAGPARPVAIRARRGRTAPTPVAASLIRAGRRPAGATLAAMACARSASPRGGSGCAAASRARAGPGRILPEHGAIGHGQSVCGSIA